MRALIMPEPFDPWVELARHEQDEPALLDACGAAALFIGRMRSDNAGDKVTGMYLEHYPEMTQNYLHKLCEEARDRWRPHDVLLLHRVGEISVGQTIVLVAVWSPHRAAALEACRYLIEELKHRAPFWKKERLPNGTARWVTGNTPGPAKTDR